MPGGVGGQRCEPLPTRFNASTVAIKKIERLKSENENQNRTVNFLNDWKFVDHQFQTNLKAACQN